MRSHEALARLAAQQYGLVTHVQLLRLGFSSARIGRSSKAMRLHRVHRGVYAVGHEVLSDHARCLAAVLASGRGAVLSHAAAAWLWGLLPTCPAVVDVSVPSHGGRREGIALHHSSTLIPEEHGRMMGIPVTALPRTLLDVAATGSPRLTWNAVERAERRDLLDLAQIDAMLKRRRGHRGAARLRKALEIYRDPAFYRARSERLFRRIVKRFGLPKPLINTWVGKFEIDAYWKRERFAVEIDGWETHRTRRAFESDRRRAIEMKLAGIAGSRVKTRFFSLCGKKGVLSDQPRAVASLRR
ncbi:MAG TPA: type IV toxin-antitoxin system AbiEi family antitoxin domain-containing protein [Solirubrobacterales bacterium]